MLFFAALIGMFPKHLPKKKVIRDTSETPRMAYVDEDIPFRSSEIHHFQNKKRVHEKEESPKMKGEHLVNPPWQHFDNIFLCFALRLSSCFKEAAKEQNFDVQHFVHNFLYTRLFWLHNVPEQIHGSSIQQKFSRCLNCYWTNNDNW